MTETSQSNQGMKLKPRWGKPSEFTQTATTIETALRGLHFGAGWRVKPDEVVGYSMLDKVAAAEVVADRYVLTAARKFLDGFFRLVKIYEETGETWLCGGCGAAGYFDQAGIPCDACGAISEEPDRSGIDVPPELAYGRFSRVNPGASRRELERTLLMTRDRIVELEKELAELRRGAA